MALDGFHSRSKVLQQCKESLRLLSDKTKVTIRWIKAHVGHDGNERADQLAKAGTKYGTPGAIANVEVTLLSEVPAPYSHLTRLVETAVEKHWSRKWLSEKDNKGNLRFRQSKHFFKKPDKGKSYQMLRQNRETLGRAIQFITGHARLRRHEAIQRHAIGDTEFSASCSICGNGDETPIHLLHDCGPLHWETMKIFGIQGGSHHDPNWTLQWKPDQLLKFINLERVVRLFEDSIGEATQSQPDNQNNDSYSSEDDENVDEEEHENAGGDSHEDQRRALVEVVRNRYQNQ
jgi:hypothetical protein